jgi:hypothetical protein
VLDQNLGAWISVRGGRDAIMGWVEESGAIESVAESSEEEREKRQERARRLRDDAFGRLLGDDWVAVEPGIYRKVEQSAQTTEDARSHSDDSLDESLMDALDSLDESLMDALPSAEDDESDVELRDEPAGESYETKPPVSRPSQGRGWWRR